MVDARVIKKQYDTRPIEGSTIPEALENFLDEVLEYGGIDPAFDQLSADNGVLSHGSYQTDRIVLRPELTRRPDRECLGCKAILAETLSSAIAGGFERRLLLDLFVLLVDVVILGDLIACIVAIVLAGSFHSSSIEEVFKPYGSESKVVRTIAAVSILLPWLLWVNENETAEVGSEA